MALALALLGGAGLAAVGCQLAIDGDRYSFSFEGSGEIVPNLPGSDDAGASVARDAGDDGTRGDGETGAVQPSPVCDGCSIGNVCVPAGVRRASNPCEVCDPGRDATTWSNRDGSCDDGLYCTIDDRCAEHRCSGAPRACDDDVACNGTSRCDEPSDECSAGANQCSAGQICDVASDSCTTTCAGCLVEGICVPAGAERTGNPCLVCQPEQSSTAYTPAPGKACGGGASECSAADTCDAAAVCQPNHLPLDTPCGSDARSVCAAHDACDGSGQCTPRFQPDGTACPDGSLCTSAESCLGGVCQLAVTACASGQSCDAATGACRCDNGGCFIGGSCVGRGVTDPGNACLVCDPDRSDTGYSPNDGASCGDPTQSPCTAPDTCAGGVCQPNHASASTPCSFGGECREPSSCDGNGGCPFIPVADGSSCDDGVFCNGSERCQAGECVPGRPRAPGCIEP